MIAMVLKFNSNRREIKLLLLFTDSRPLKNLSFKELHKKIKTA